MSRIWRQPIDASFNQRIGILSGVAGASGIAGIGIAGVMIAGNGSQVSNKDGRATNVYLQTVGGRKYLVKRPGSSSTLTPQAGSIGNAITVCSGGALANKIVSAFGATNSSIYDSTTQLVTNNADTTVITGRATGIVETDISGTATLLISSSDSTAWYYQNGGTVTKISDADFPGNAALTLAGTFACISGFSFIMTTNGRLYASDLNSVTAWTASSYASTDAYPDGGIGCIRRKETIMAFGRDSVEFWKNAGNSPFPLVRQQEMTVRVGAVSANAITQISDMVFWAGSTTEGGISIFSYSDGLQRLSTPEIDAALVVYGASNITLSAMRFAGRSFVLVICSSQITYAYCIEEKFWSIWLTATYPLWFKTAAQSTGSSLVTYMITNKATSGIVYLINDANFLFQDAGNPYTAVIQWPQGENLGVRQFYEEVEIFGDEETAASAITLWKTDDDYQTTDTLAVLDMSSSRVRKTRCGSAYKRAYGISHAANTSMRISAIGGRKTVGTG